MKNDDVAPIEVEDLCRALDGVLLGKPAEVRLLVAVLVSNGHVLIEDVPGTGKTTLAKALALAIGAKFRRIQFTPDLLPADVTGGGVYRPDLGRFEIMEGPIFTEVLLADEINRASPRTQSALLEAMEERQVSLEGQARVLPKLFLVMATQNPVEFHGVFPLPEAQMDRFMIKLQLGYPDATTELNILHSHKASRPLDHLQTILEPSTILRFQQQVSEVHVDEALAKYIVTLVAATRTHAAVRLGASPRAGMAIYRLAQAKAWMQGRSHVDPEDIQQSLRPVLAHRISAKDGKGESSVLAVIEDLRTRTPLPR